MAGIEKIVSGGQTGADRAALDFAIERRIPHGGWCPAGRKAEDGPIGPRYQLKETPSAGYVQRTERNARDSDGTVVFSIAPVLTGGSQKTIELAHKHRKPVVHITRDGGSGLPQLALLHFIQAKKLKVLNVAGPRASEELEVGAFVKEVLGKALDLLHRPAPGNPVGIVLGNRETIINEMMEMAVRLTHKGISFHFDTATRASDLILLAARPETRLVLFVPPGNIDVDPESPAATREGETVRIIKTIKAKHPIPIIVMAVQQYAREMLLAAGADVFLDIQAPAQLIVDAVAKCLGLEPKKLGSP
ncbi:MAG: putative molybdenum carrier protein [Verrucomicrobia bacterium]|nr:putative molybdenum carrier protein [Verrucomicrobiota bacterium]